jgi:hypothetical protein
LHQNTEVTLLAYCSSQSVYCWQYRAAPVANSAEFCVPARGTL